MIAIPAAPITALYAAICALIIVGLAMGVIATRFRLRVGIGDGGDSRLARAIRTHANAIEFVPIALLLMLVAEINGARPALLHGCGVVLVAARIAHAAGLRATAGLSVGRTAGVAGTVAVITVLAVVDLAAFIR